MCFNGIVYLQGGYFIFWY